jgi:hypothetical protein
MSPARCTICGDVFINSTQEKWLREKIDDQKVLAHLLAYCPECRVRGQGFVKGR